MPVVRLYIYKNNLTKVTMAKKGKTKGWIKGLIAVAVIVVIGGLGYYGANGEMFQGRIKLSRPSAENVKIEDKLTKVGLDTTQNVIQPLTVDGVTDKLITDKLITEKVAIVEYDKVAYDIVYPSMIDLSVGDVDVAFMDIAIANNDSTNILVSELTIFEDGGGLYNYEVFVDGVKIDAKVEIEIVFIDNLKKEVKKITFDFDAPYGIDGMNSKSFRIKADVMGGESFAAHTLDSIVTDKGVQINTNYQFNVFSRDITGKVK